MPLPLLAVAAPMAGPAAAASAKFIAKRLVKETVAKNAAKSAAGMAESAGVRQMAQRVAAGQSGPIPVSGSGGTRGSKMFMYGIGLFLAVCGLLIFLWLFGVIGNRKSKRKLAQPSPMNNARVSRPTHEERMFTNKPDRRNKYRKQLSTGGDEYGGYYGSNSRGFSQSEESYLHPMNNNSNVQKPQFYLKNPGNNNPSILSEINLSDDPAYEEELYDEMKSILMAKDNRRKARLSKSIKNGKYNTGHIDQVSEINVASSLSASNNFQGPFVTNNGDRVVQRYIQPIEKRGVTSDALNFASITK